jgi:hypothetical protein
VRYKVVTPISLGLESISGFGYSFSNIGNNIHENGRPYVVVGAVDISGEKAGESTAVMLKSALTCVGLKPECKSKGTVSKRILAPPRISETRAETNNNTEGKCFNIGTIKEIYLISIYACIIIFHIY